MGALLTVDGISSKYLDQLDTREQPAACLFDYSLSSLDFPCLCAEISLDKFPKKLWQQHS